MRKAYRTFVGRQLDVVEKIILKCILEEVLDRIYFCILL
jgi:hypothetical protein